MKTIIRIVSILICTLTAFGQSVQQKVAKFENAKYYSVHYDKFQDKTTVSLAPVKTLNSKGKTLLGFAASISFVFKGTEVNADAKYWLSFVKVSFNRPGQPFSSDHVILLADGKRIVIENGQRASSISQSALGTTDYFNESLVFRLTRIDLETLAKAKKVEFQVGGLEGMYGGLGLTAFSNILSLSAK